MDETTDAIWGALASPVRRRILDLLRDGPRTTGELAGLFPALSRFAVMQHLDVLAKGGLVLVRREGRQRFNYLNAVPLRAVYERWVSQYAGTAAAATLALKRHVERPEGGAMPDENPQRAGKIVKLEMECRLNAPIEKVFAAMTTELDEWWAFRFNDDSKVVFEPWVGGRVFEDWGDGRGALYGQVCYFDPPYKIGTRGPGGIEGNYSNLNWEIFQRDGEGTLYRKSFRLWGEVPEEAEQMYTRGMKAIMEQLLREYVEQGKGRKPERSAS